MNQDVGEILRSRVLDSGLTMKQCFREFDKDNSRFIEREEMVNVLKSLNVPFTNVRLVLIESDEILQ